MDTGFDPNPQTPTQVVGLDAALTILTNIPGVVGTDYHGVSNNYPAHLDLYLAGGKTLRIFATPGGGLQFRANFTP